MQGIARAGDSAAGTCTAHSSPQSWTGVVSTGTAGFKAEGSPVAAVGDGGDTSCGHHFVISGGSSVCTGVGGKVVARKGDPVVVVEGGSGSLTGGSSLVTCA